MEVRWKIIRYPKPTAIEVFEYRDMHGVGLYLAKKKLTTPDKKVLQYREHESLDWIDVNEEVEYV